MKELELVGDSQAYACCFAPFCLNIILIVITSTEVQLSTCLHIAYTVYTYTMKDEDGNC